MAVDEKIPWFLDQVEVMAMLRMIRRAKAAALARMYAAREQGQRSEGGGEDNGQSRLLVSRDCTTCKRRNPRR